MAYLLARAADTIADTRALSPAHRLECLLSFRALVKGRACPEAINQIVARVQGESDGVSLSERTLLNSLAQAFGLLEALTDEDRARVESVVVTLTEGMELDLTTFPPEDSGTVTALNTPEELDRYTYLVAGCVGEFWTLTAKSHEPRLSNWDAGYMGELGVRFGKALQLTNVLRDVPRDLRNGRCYLPESDLAAVGMAPSELLDPANAARARGVLVPWMRTALGHFEAAERYVLATPRRLRPAAAGGAVAHPAGVGDAGYPGAQRWVA